ncbi:hypothetical protein ACJX0J_032734, partial [Zea mays]
IFFVDIVISLAWYSKTHYIHPILNAVLFSFWIVNLFLLNPIDLLEDHLHFGNSIIIYLGLLILDDLDQPILEEEFPNVWLEREQKVMFVPVAVQNIKDEILGALYL